MVEPVKVRSKRRQDDDDEDDRLAERTEVIQGPENILNFILPRYSYIKECIDACFDYSGPSHVTTTEPVWQELVKLQKRGIKIRFLTDIRKENIIYCKKFLTLKNSDIRHLDSVKGNYGIADRRECFEHAVNKEGELPTHAIFTTVRGIVDTRQFLFDDLWKRSMPAKDRMKEIEEGVTPDIIEILNDTSEIINIAYRLVSKAKDEILIIFHTSNALVRQEKAGGLDLLIENVVKCKTHVKILVPIEDKITSIIQRLQQIDGIHIRNIEPTIQTRMTILVVDKKYSLVVELKDDSKEDLKEAIGLATYSSSKSTVLSYVSIFDALWKQSELREELLIRSMAQKEFINIAAHELRNPIQPILGLSDVLLRSDNFLNIDKNSDIKRKDIIEIIARNARRLQRLTEDILDITRIEGKTLKLNKHNFVLSKVIKELLKDYTAQLRNSSKSVNLSFSSKSPELDSIPLLADQDRIKQVICNLLDNAIKFTQEGEITVATEIDDKLNQGIVKIKDTGKGIDSEILPRLFTKFVTKSASGGTGLGLYICKGIIDAHDGRIWAENNSKEYGNSDDCKGATFSFSLPLTHF
ncbi:MAG: HAMP domain-containing sensor histidine kinase [Nitrososphaeraceae archaeon]